MRVNVVEDISNAKRNNAGIIFRSSDGMSLPGALLTIWRGVRSQTEIIRNIFVSPLHAPLPPSPPLVRLLTGNECGVIAFHDFKNHLLPNPRVDEAVVLVVVKASIELISFLSSNGFFHQIGVITFPVDPLLQLLLLLLVLVLSGGASGLTRSEGVQRAEAQIDSDLLRLHDLLRLLFHPNGDTLCRSSCVAYMTDMIELSSLTLPLSPLRFLTPSTSPTTIDPVWSCPCYHSLDYSTISET